MNTLRRLGLLLALGALLAFVSPSIGGDPKWRMVFAVAHDCIQDESWKEVAEVLQVCLYEDDKTLVEVDRAKKAVKVTVHSEAENILKKLPKPGREAYEARSGAQAQKLLKEANNEAKLKDLVRPYLFTKAGAAGAEKLGLLQFDAARPKDAAKTFARLAGVVPGDSLAPPTLYKAALSCRAAGDGSYRDYFWNELRKQAPKGFKLRDRYVTLAEAEKEIQK